MSALFVLMLAFYVLLTGVRFALTAAFFARTAPARGDARGVTVLQPILSGDPTLESCLSANLRNQPEARFIWLIDDDDAEAQRLAARYAAPNLTALFGPPPRDGESPKAAKLARGLPHVTTPLFAVLDDDTVLRPNALAQAAGALTKGDLVTGLPLYAHRADFWSTLLSGFVNGAALITYPPAAMLRAQRTINGMFYLGRADELRALGGFEAIARELTDDYAMARLYLDHGKTIAQSAVIHPIATHVRDGAHYASLMRRWMIFANRYVRENLSPFTLGVIGAPTLLPMLLVLAGAFLGWQGLVAALLTLAAKAALMARMRLRYAADRPRALDMAAEIAADVLTPLHLAAALLSPNRLQWRTRAIRIDGAHIRYG